MSQILLQLGIAWTGLFVTFLTLGDALVDYRLIRRLGLDGPRKALTMGELRNELGRVTLHMTIIVPSMLVLMYRVPYPWTGGSVIFIFMTFVISFLSVNSWHTRRRVLREIEKVEKKR